MLLCERVFVCGCVKEKWVDRLVLCIDDDATPLRVHVTSLISHLNPTQPSPTPFPELTPPLSSPSHPHYFPATVPTPHQAPY